MGTLIGIRSLHLDVWSFIATSQRKTSFYDPLERTISLPSLAQRFSNLTELSFAPSFSSSIKCTGNFDSLLLVRPPSSLSPLTNSSQTTPHLRCLELRADQLTPAFFRTLLLLPPSHPIHYIGIHVFPTHAPPTIDETTGSSVPTVTVFVYIVRSSLLLGLEQS